MEEVDFRWWIPGPGEDESLYSIVERANDFYGSMTTGPRQDAWHGAAAALGLPRSLDNLDSHDLARLASVLGVSTEVLQSHRMADHPSRLHESQRRAYCPTCWSDADKKKLPRTFRRAWASIAALSCPKHQGTPLQWAGAAVARGEIRDPRQRPPMISAQAARILQWIDAFAQQLENTSFSNAPWPAHWRANPHEARRILCACLSNLGAYRGYALICNLEIPDCLSPWVARPQGLMESLNGNPWNAVRYLGPPALRRAAFWLASGLIVRDIDSTLRPRMLFGQPMTATIAHWDAEWQFGSRPRCSEVLSASLYRALDVGSWLS